MLDQYPSLTANWSYPTAVRFGPGRIVELPEALKAAGIAKPLFVTDPGLVNLPIVVKALAHPEEGERSGRGLLQGRRQSDAEEPRGRHRRLQGRRP